MDNLLLVVYLAGIFYFAMGWLSKLRPKKEITNRAGYHTKRARSSQKAWDFAQRYSAISFQWAGLGLVALGLAAPYLPGVGRDNLAIPFVGLFVALIISPMVATELALKKRF
ncbi:MAG TPA: SdpI family protein [Saprospiraceae bacterium]|nr:SdpI family protein [Saprospiraceae bacterium]